MMNAAMPTMKMLRRRRRLALLFGERTGRGPRGPPGPLTPGPPSRMSPGSSSDPIGDEARTDARPTLARPVTLPVLPPLVGIDAEPEKPRVGIDPDPEKPPVGGRGVPGTEARPDGPWGRGPGTWARPVGGSFGSP